MALPPRYEQMSPQELESAIWRAKKTLGADLTILGHHYQRDEVIQFADFRGDSLGLSQQAASVERARYIVFCGVHFMAETAAMLCKPEQIVVQPVVEALCPMARMANRKEAALAWEALSALWPDDLIPVTYQNSTAEVKAFVGEHGGAVCTSSNARQVLEWAWSQKARVLFMPDEHLGTNTALAMGLPREQIGAWDWADPPDPQTLRDCRIVVWKGYCYVHDGFTVADVQQARERYPGALVIVHPECRQEVVAVSDGMGSTTGLIDMVVKASPGSTIVVGTEWHLVNRLQSQFTDRTVVPLAKRGCVTMAMTHMKDLLYVLDGLLEGAPRNIVTVDATTARWARVALARMLEVK